MAPQQASFANVRAATAAAARFAMEVPSTARMASAAAEQVKDKPIKLKREEWQAEAYRHANDIGELGYVLNLKAGVCSAGDLAATERDEAGNVIDPDKDNEGRVIIQGDREKAERVLDALRGPQGAADALLFAGSIHDQIAGEGILLGEPVEDQTDAIAWELVSVLELVQDQQNKDRLVRKRSASARGALSVIDEGSDALTNVDPDAYTSRYHRHDWAHSGDATSALRRNAAACREIILWTQLIESTIKSRLSSGILFVPEEVTFSNDDDLPEDVDEADVFSQTLAADMSTPITDPRSQASLVPLIIRAQSEMIEKFRLMSLTDDSLSLGDMLNARRDALRRLAAGLDIPLEIMEGMGDSNHWSSAGIDQSFVAKHVVPLGERLARWLTVAYFRRMLILKEGMDEATAERWSLTYDASAIMTRLDVAASAESLHNRTLISDDALITAHGFDPDEVRPSEDEIERRRLERLVITPSVNNRPLLPALIDFSKFPDLDPEVVAAFLAPPQTGSGPPAESEPTADDPDETEPGEPSDQIGGPDTPATGEPTPDDEAELAVLVERIRGAASGAVDRALERAASQVITNARKLPAELRARVDQPAFRTGPRKTDVLRMLSPADYRTIQRPPEALLKDAFVEFNQRAVMWLKTHYERHGQDSLTADEDARRVISDLENGLDQLAMAAFTSPLEREDDLAVPVAMVTDALNGVRA